MELVRSRMIDEGMKWSEVDIGIEGLVDLVWSTDDEVGYHKGLYRGTASESVIMRVRECGKEKEWGSNEGLTG